MSRPPTPFTYTARIKTRKQIDAEIPRHLQGWWADVSAGRVLDNLREATEADLARCNLNPLASRDPRDYLCENIERGALVSRMAIQWLRLELPVTFRIGDVPLPLLGVCEAGHQFAHVPGHPMDDGQMLCPNCMRAKLNEMMEKYTLACAA